MKPPKQPVKEKRVKAWAVLDCGKLYSVDWTRRAAKYSYCQEHAVGFGNWAEFYAKGARAIRVTITYRPNKKTR